MFPFLVKFFKEDFKDLYCCSKMIWILIWAAGFKEEAFSGKLSMAFRTTVEIKYDFRKRRGKGWKGREGWKNRSTRKKEEEEALEEEDEEHEEEEEALAGSEPLCFFFTDDFSLGLITAERAHTQAAASFQFFYQIFPKHEAVWKTLSGWKLKSFS